jgi:hypothetical protein
MKRFFVSALFVTLFFLGLGTLIEKVGARFKSDDKALALIAAARAAIGGDNAVSGIQSLRIKGTSTHTFKVDGTDRTENGETEIALQLPDKLSKMVKIGDENGNNTGQKIERRQQVVVVTKDENGNGTFKSSDGTEPTVQKVIVRKSDGSNEELKPGDGDKIIIRKVDGEGPLKTENGEIRTLKINKDDMEARHHQVQQNDLFRLALGLLLSPPANMAVNYTFGGETTVDSTSCNLVVADLGGSSVKLYLDSSSNLPVMMSYTGEQMPMLVHFNKQVQAAPANGGDKDVVFFRTPEGPAATTEFQVRFSNYQGVNGVQLPFTWTTTAGDMREVFSVTSYEVNPANIADSFQQPKVMFRVKKDGQ